jgi:hypothetical protein
VGPGIAGGNAGEGGSGGGGAGGGGCFLANFAMEALPPNEQRNAKRFFNDFHRLFVRAYPNNGVQLFKTYQVVARKIINAISQAGTEREEQAYIYNKLIKPTGQMIEKKELPSAIRNLQGVVITLADKYKIALPAKRVLK